MKKKGFTLVELLVVIAVLAILVLLVVPNAIKLYNNAKQRSFVNELKTIYKTAEAQYTKDSIRGGYEQIYARNNSSNCQNTLKLTGRTELEYYIEFNGQGKVIKYFAQDGTYHFTYEGEELKINEIESVEQISKITNGRFIRMSCTSASIQKPEPASPDSYLMEGNRYSATGFYLRTNIKKGEIERITFVDSLGLHSTSDDNTWDVSAGRNGDVLAWATDNDNNGLYELTIGANGDVYVTSGR